MLSVIIPTRNRADLLRLALKSLQSQTLSADSFEVLVIDNGSTDNTKQVSASLQKQLGNVRYFFAPTPGLHVGRHLGMKMAKSDILVYADDDIEAFPTWLEGITEAFQDKDVVLVGGKNMPKFGAQPPPWIMQMWRENHHGHRIMGYLSILDLGNNIMTIDPSYVYGCNFSIRRFVLDETWGFHPDAMPDDMIQYRGDGESYVSRYIKKKGYKTVYYPKASIYHLLPAARLTDTFFRKRSFLQGISDSYSCLRNGSHPSRYALWRLMNWLRSPGFQWTSYLHARARCMANAYRSGFFLHQREAYRDAALYRWIMKEHYLDE